jgi:hypothetical protein
MAKKPTNSDWLQKDFDVVLPFMAYAMKMEAENHPDFDDMFAAVIGWQSKIFPYLGKSRVPRAVLSESHEYVNRMRRLTKIYKFGDPAEPLRTAIPLETYMKRARVKFGLDETPAKYKPGDKVDTPAGPGVVARVWAITTTVIYSLNTQYRIEYSVKLPDGRSREFSEDELSEVNQ